MAVAESEKPQTNAKSRRLELIVAALFLGVNVIVPLTAGEIYPFTTSPMFRDQPDCYCEFEIIDAAGNELPLEDFGLHLVYDGNPPGLGVGIEPQPTLCEFGCVATVDEIRAHVRNCLMKNGPDSVQVTRRIHQREKDGNRLEAVKDIINIAIDVDSQAGDSMTEGSARE